MTRRRQQKPSSSSSNQNLLYKQQQSDDKITSITHLCTLPRATFLIITPILVSVILQVSPNYVEPIYGNVFSTIYFNEIALSSLAFGIIIGIGFIAKTNTLSQITRDNKINSALISGIDWCGILFALSPIIVRALFHISGLLGPYAGPHVTQFGLAYPIMLSIGFLNVMSCARLSREQRRPIFRWMLYVIIHFTIIITLIYVLYSVMTRGRSCRRLYFSGLLLALVGTVFKLLWCIYGELSLEGDASQRRKPTFNVSLRSQLPFITIQLLPQILIIIMVIYNANFNSHCNIAIIQNTVDNNIEYNILARNESITGWIEVVEEIKPRNIRVLRAGHSLLGGIFRETRDSIYGCFYLMEAVRLIERGVSHEHERALQIGLGIGVLTASLQAHNVDLDVVELDPVVYDFAVNYFDLKREHKIYLQDGRKFINNADAQIYDYVLHDVFTGGSVPSTLFSIEALEQIKRILKKNGVLGLNFVSSEQWPHAESFALVAKTIKTVFPYVKCFREGPRVGSVPFQNMVFFASSNYINFNIATQEDFLGSASREYVLGNFLNWQINLNKYQNVTDVITDEHNPLDKLQRISAFEHWKVMRELFPQEFWINF
ncbi:S-adenosyl-L-methionine-dependent methyltransferase [Gigaspora rosea]|uniref:S-adenosyl-L-methionine-dependent methyltransferase n=1 Tax=Gigaspora rosea TaxID=44941 RepID=A0A397U3A5_9GLOM|nr:S-adenosyl-L-methionine-dependent methyltransferase [Gigaspora rosea]